MTKPKAPETSLLLVVLKGYSAWSKKSGYSKSLLLTKAMLASMEEVVEKTGGRLLAFDGDTISVVFQGLALAGIPQAVLAGGTLRNALTSHIKAMTGVKILTGVTLARVPKGRLRKDMSNLEGFCRPVIRAFEKQVASLPSGSPLALTPLAAELGSKKVTIKGGGKRSKLLFLVKGPRPGGSSARIQRIVEAVGLALSRLEPNLLAEPQFFSITVFRIVKSKGAEKTRGIAIPKDPFSSFKDKTALFGGEVLPGPRDALMVLFSNLEEGEAPARAAVRFGFIAPETLRRRLRKIEIVEAVGIGVASGKAPVGEIHKRTGKAFRRAVQDARKFASNGAQAGPRIDAETRNRILGAYEVGPGKERGKTPGFPVLESGLPPAPDIRLDSRPKKAGARLGSATNKLRDLLRRMGREKKCTLLSFEAEDEAIRAMGSRSLSELGRSLGWKILSSRCTRASLWCPLGPWKDMLSLLCDIGPSDPPARVKTILTTALKAAHGSVDEIILASMLEWFHATQEGAPRRWIPAPLKRRMIEKGLQLILAHCAASTPTVFLLRESHLADRSSLEFMKALRLGLRDRPVVLAAFNEPGTGPHKPDMVVPLKPLGPPQVQLMVQELLVSKDVPATVRDKVKALGGNPLRLIMFLKALEEKGQLRLTDGKWRLVGDRTPGETDLDSLIRFRFKSLSREFKKLLGTVSLLGGTVPWLDFSQILPPPHLEVLLSLEVSGWLEVCRHGRGGVWAFPHEKIRERGTALLSVKDRMSTHAKAVSILEKPESLRAGEVRHRIVWHLREAGNRKEFSEELIRLGRDVKALGFPNEAEACFSEVLRIPRPNDISKAALMLDRAEALTEMGSSAEAIAQIETALKSKAVRIPKRKKSAASILSR